jgi:fumarate hydratase class II
MFSLSLDDICVSHQADVQHTRVHILSHSKVNQDLYIYIYVLDRELDERGKQTYKQILKKGRRLYERLSA